MNPATPGLTVLLIPPDGDAALLAPEWCGGRVPEMHRDVLAPPGWSPQPAPAWHIEGVSPTYERALVLVLDGAPVAMGCDRAVRWVNAGERAQLRTQTDYDDPAYIRVILHEAAKLGARVVLLRDGREVTE